MPAGVPTIETIPTPHKIIQTPAFIAILYEYNMQYRQIFTDALRVTERFQRRDFGHMDIDITTTDSKSLYEAMANHAPPAADAR